MNHQIGAKEIDRKIFRTTPTFKSKKPHTIIYLSEQGRNAFREYKKNLKQVLDDLPD
jgi:hypothetical protein